MLTALPRFSWTWPPLLDRKGKERIRKGRGRNEKRGYGRKERGIS